MSGVLSSIKQKFSTPDNGTMDNQSRVDNQSHTFKRTCLRQLKFHRYDWLVIIGLMILEAMLLKVIHPHKRFVSADNIEKFPLRNSPTVPVAALPIICFVIPLVFIIGYYIYKRDTYDLHNAILGLVFSVVATACITDTLKNAVGRARPDFFWRCFPDGIPHYNSVTGEVMCTAKPSDVRQGYKSFPSGHTSWSFAGLAYLSLYLAGKIAVFDRRGRVLKLVIVALPLVGATLVGISIVDDYWHHWEDAFAGGVIGLVVAYLSYRQHFPSVASGTCMKPYPPAAPTHAPLRPTNGSTNDLESGRDVETPRV